MSFVKDKQLEALGVMQAVAELGSALNLLATIATGFLELEHGHKPVTDRLQILRSTLEELKEKGFITGPIPAKPEMITIPWLIGPSPMPFRSTFDPKSTGNPPQNVSDILVGEEKNRDLVPPDYNPTDWGTRERAYESQTSKDQA